MQIWVLGCDVGGKVWLEAELCGELGWGEIPETAADSRSVYTKPQLTF